MLSVLLALGVLTPAASADEATVTAAQAFQQFTANARTSAAVRDSAPFYLRVAGRGDRYCLDNFANGGGANNSPVGLWECNGGISERWRFRVWNSGHYYGYNLVNERSGRCLDYPSSAGNNIGWQFNVYDCKNGAAPGQNFHVTIQSNGDLTFTFEATSFVVAMDAFGDYWHGNGSPVGLWTYVAPGNNLQHWY
ncbi:RICIN domain-containing protein [Actinophytocola xanthii]|uniref:Ricin B lectin domain-containing protein n=1 Tax=Actinophytocola xanthii TaxID=1912961 RepID=A0A1Q8CJZ7_9PSEU|nr:RICIN domain-containing protein [Actinophytocola xanthii]OLF14674.1 hypothetical protein BU204_25625 [Actinophytocola xanthii]